jgi:hypothetical protein
LLGGEPLYQKEFFRCLEFFNNNPNKELEFNYQLKQGISNDRLGYLILEREGVVDLLKD